MSVLYSIKRSMADVLYDAIYDDKKPYNVVEAKTDDAGLYSHVKQDIEYSVSDNVVRVASDDKKADIDYGCDQRRISMNVNDGNELRSKIYVGNNEFVNADDKNVKLTYLMGPMGVYGACAIDEDGNKSVLYIHKDNILEEVKPYLDICKRKNVVRDTIDVLEYFLQN